MSEHEGARRESRSAFTAARQSLGRCAAFALLSTVAGAQAVLVVDDDGPGPGIDHTTIQAAVDAATPGTIVLVRAGFYTETIVIDGKSLVLQAEPLAFLGGTTTFTVRNTAASDEVLIRNFNLTASGTTNEVIRLEDNAGLVWLETLFIAGSPLVQTGSADTMVVERCQRVVLRTTQLIGGTNMTGAGGAALRSTDSDLFLYRSGCNGGVGGVGQPGGSGAVLTGGTHYVSESAFNGGSGGIAATTCGTGGDGGTGLIVGLGDPSVRLRNTQLLGGVGGPPQSGCGSTGAAGAPSVEQSGTVTTKTEAIRTTQADGLRRENQSTAISVLGGTGETVFLYYSTNPFPVYLKNSFDPVLLAAPLARAPMGVVMGIVAAVLVPPMQLPASVEGLTVFVQPLYLKPGGGFALGAPASVVVIDDTL